MAFLGQWGGVGSGGSEIFFFGLGRGVTWENGSCGATGGGNKKSDEYFRFFGYVCFVYFKNMRTPFPFECIPKPGPLPPPPLWVHIRSNPREI